MVAASNIAVSTKLLKYPPQSRNLNPTEHLWTGGTGGGTGCAAKTFAGPL